MAAGTALNLVMLLGAIGACAYHAAMLVCAGVSRLAAGPYSAASVGKRACQALGCIPLVGDLLHRARAAKRAKAMRSCMPTALRLLATSLGAGSSLVQALRYAAAEGEEPLRGEIEQAVWDLDAGKGFTRAMEGLRERTGEPEFSFLAVAMEIQHRSGGSLGNALEVASEALAGNAELAEELRTKTAQGRLSMRIVAFMPVALLLVLSLFSQGYVSRFFASPPGVSMFVAALALEVLGVLLVRKTLSIDFLGGRGGAA